MATFIGGAVLVSVAIAAYACARDDDRARLVGGAMAMASFVAAGVLTTCGRLGDAADVAAAIGACAAIGLAITPAAWVAAWRSAWRRSIARAPARRSAARPPLTASGAFH